MLQVFIALILISFLGLFALLSFPMKSDDKDILEKPKAQPETNE